MSKIKRIDLHMHSTISDGTNTPAELLDCVKAAGLELFSLTDHDAIRGCSIIKERLEDEGEQPVFVSGIEFSCRDEDGKYHILGFGYDRCATAMTEVVARGHSFRMKKMRARLDHLRTAFGFDFSKAEEEEILALDNPGKPHLANLLIKRGYAASKDEAFRNYLNLLRFRSEYLRPEEAIAGILGAGGIPVLAHPAYGSGDELLLGEEMEARLVKLIGYGLQGLEAYYSGFTGKLQESMLSLADRHHLYVTAGSDYHGANKMITLGDTGCEDASQASEALQRFLEDVPKR